MSLIEACIASLVLLVGLVSAAQLLVVGASATRAAGDATRAAVIAAQKIEELRATPWAAMASGEDRVGNLARRWTVEPAAPFPGRLVGIRVVVERPGGGAAVRATLHLLRARPSP